MTRGEPDGALKSLGALAISQSLEGDFVVHTSNDLAGDADHRLVGKLRATEGSVAAFKGAHTFINSLLNKGVGFRTGAFTSLVLPAATAEEHEFVIFRGRFGDGRGDLDGVGPGLSEDDESPGFSVSFFVNKSNIDLVVGTSNKLSMN